MDQSLSFHDQAYMNVVYIGVNIEQVEQTVVPRTSFFYELMNKLCEVHIKKAGQTNTDFNQKQSKPSSIYFSSEPS